MRVFLDSNIIVSALGTRGLCADAFREVLLRHELIISDLLIDEIHRVLINKLRLPGPLIEDVGRLLRNNSDVAEPPPEKIHRTSDPTDNSLISAAVHGRAELFVTGDTELLRLPPLDRPAVISPRQFWERSRVTKSPDESY